jgi:hypothetical protein
MEEIFKTYLLCDVWGVGDGERVFAANGQNNTNLAGALACGSSLLDQYTSTTYSLASLAALALCAGVLALCAGVAALEAARRDVRRPSLRVSTRTIAVVRTEPGIGIFILLAGIEIGVAGGVEDKVGVHVAACDGVDNFSKFETPKSAPG